MSRSELAELVNDAVYRHTGRLAGLDGHYVAKLERGIIRWPGADYRSALREVLGAATDSDLGFHRPRRCADTGTLLPPSLLSANETERERLARVLASPDRADMATVRHLADVLDAQRHIEDTIGSSRLLDMVRAEIELVEKLTRQAPPELRPALVALVAEYHQFAGTVCDDSGDHRAALHHYELAMTAGKEVSDANLVASIFGYRSHLAWRLRDPVSVIELAQAGLRDSRRLSPAVLGALAQMQARGHAMHSDSAIADRLIDATEQLTNQAYEHPEDEPPWAYRQTPERVLFQRSVAYDELGRHREAGVLAEKARIALPSTYRRDHGRWNATLALARAHDGDVPGALVAGWQALVILLDTGSAYTIADLQRMRRVLDRQQVDQALLDEFDRVLHLVTGSEQ
ncbi:MAG: hypothetical protein ACRDRV_03310 [Pseudonocardiaceae bacterium]